MDGWTGVPTPPAADRTLIFQNWAYTVGTVVLLVGVGEDDSLYLFSAPLDF